MKHLLHDITRITDDIETSIQGDLLLSLITPKQLFSVLSNVSDNLPPGTNLPLSLSNNNLLTFYKHLHTLVIPLENRFHIVIALPLVVNAYQFNLFSALSMPYTPPDHNLTIQYALENSQIAISLTTLRFDPNFGIITLPPDPNLRSSVTHCNMVDACAHILRHAQGLRAGVTSDVMQNRHTSDCVCIILNVNFVTRVEIRAHIISLIVPCDYALGL